MIKKISLYTIILIIAIAISSCSNTKFLTGGEQLYVGSYISIESEKGVKITSDLRDELSDVIYPEENTKIFGMKIPLAIYNRIKEPEKKKGVKYYFKYKLGEKPVLYNSENNEKVMELLKNRLEINGFFNNDITVKTKVKNKKTKVFYKVVLRKPYFIDTIIYSLDSSLLSKYIIKSNKSSILKRGDNYSLKNVKKERQRISSFVRNLGYYNYKDDFLLYKADTLDNKLSFIVVLKKKLNVEDLKQYRINSINVYGGFKKSEINRDLTQVNNINYYYNNNLFNPEKITKNVFFIKDSLYSDFAYRRTLSYYYGYNRQNGCTF